MKRHFGIIIACGAVCCGYFAGCASMFSGGGTSTGGGPSSDPNDFLNSGRTASFFTAIQVDPRSEDTAGPQFVAQGDFNDDGMLDLVSAWNESQPVQIHVQRRTTTGAIQFATAPLGGTTPIARVSGLLVEDMDQDGFDDVVVLVKDTGLVAQCDRSREDCEVTETGGFLPDALDGEIIIFYNPLGAALSMPWEAVVLNQSNLAGTDEGTLPEEGGYSGIDIGDVDGDGAPDIVVALNSAEGDPPLTPQVNSVDFYPNPGGALARTTDGWSRFQIYRDLPAIGDVRLSDVDGDGDLDVVATYPTAKSANVRWVPNPIADDDPSAVYEAWPFAVAIGQVAPGANTLQLGDIDRDGLDDVVVKSREGFVIQWFKRPSSPSQTFIRNPWQVFTIAEFASRAPGAVSLGDLTGDGWLDASISADGAVAMFEPSSPLNEPESIFDQWIETLIIDDSPEQDTTQADPNDLLNVSTDPNAIVQEQTATLVNALLIADVDGDGANDIVGTLDRIGLTGDALVLFLNTGG